MTLLPKFTATPAVNRLILRGQYLGQRNYNCAQKVQLDVVRHFENKLFGWCDERV